MSRGPRLSTGRHGSEPISRLAPAIQREVIELPVTMAEQAYAASMIVTHDEAVADKIDVSLSVPPAPAITVSRSPSGDCRFDSCDLPRLNRPPIAQPRG